MNLHDPLNRPFPGDYAVHVRHNGCTHVYTLKIMETQWGIVALVHFLQRRASESEQKCNHTLHIITGVKSNTAPLYTFTCTCTRTLNAYFYLRVLNLVKVANWVKVEKIVPTKMYVYICTTKLY